MKLRTAVRLVETDYGWVLLDESSGGFFSLNPSGVLAVRTMLDGGGVDEAVTSITDRYAVDAGTARADVEELLGELDAAKLVTR
ncbi:lasso peptide biosynthesis PqqD family chaperone [Kribbella antibiotica]|uniref:Lasso peptide biosynthesis PqqD family chaperone n=1 Tax=Kribbella antibiotica TaxID=190195 RepID=A0A4R5A0K0_9ACTN|nr:lasso peptide biosynthesis PqqD family chaperone [Kribbella antibiotica]TDD63002.1 lasso peptide biosynthesis PqqD family chaperone [Kribbella antibiotica]